MPVDGLNDGEWSGPPRGWRGGGKGNHKAQRALEKLKNQLARKLAREAGTPRRLGGPEGSHSEAQKQKATLSRRRLCGNQTQLGVTAIAKQVPAKAGAQQKIIGFARVGSK